LHQYGTAAQLFPEKSPLGFGLAFQQYVRTVARVRPDKIRDARTRSADILAMLRLLRDPPGMPSPQKFEFSASVYNFFIHRFSAAPIPAASTIAEHPHRVSNQKASSQKRLVRPFAGRDREKPIDR
jgi:hypothetical protein